MGPLPKSGAFLPVPRSYVLVTPELIRNMYFPPSFQDIFGTFYRSGLAQTQTTPLPSKHRLLRCEWSQGGTPREGGPSQENLATHLHLGHGAPGDLEQTAQPHSHQQICGLAQEVCWNNGPPRPTAHPSALLTVSAPQPQNSLSEEILPLYSVSPFR